ncbi:L27 domain protein, partial [Cooperia oncophora]
LYTCFFQLYYRISQLNCRPIAEDKEASSINRDLVSTREAMREVNSAPVAACVKKLNDVKNERDQLRAENALLRKKLGIPPGTSWIVLTLILSILTLHHRRLKLSYDYNSVLNVLCHLDVGCFPVAVYRLGSPMKGKNRLLKVIMPSSYYQRMAVRRAPRLRSPSVKPERKRRREERLHYQSPVVKHLVFTLQMLFHIPTSHHRETDFLSPALFYSNIRSFPKNCSFLDLVIRDRFDLYLFTETWLKKAHSVPSMLSDWISDYSIVRCDRARRTGGGVAMMIRKTVVAHIGSLLEATSEALELQQLLHSNIIEACLRAHDIVVSEVYYLADETGFSTASS